MWQREERRCPYGAKPSQEGMPGQCLAARFIVWSCLEYDWSLVKVLVLELVKRDAANSIDVAKVSVHAQLLGSCCVPT